MTDFIIIGNKNAITYKEIFPYLKDNKMWLGYNSPKEFDQPDGDEPKVMNGLTRWFTNLEHSKRKAFIGLTRKYNPTDYPKYDNYDAIEVGRVEDIPKDYDGVMGVPISFLGKYNPNQFEILDARDYADDERLKKKSTYLIKDADGSINGKPTYARILIRKVKELPTEKKVSE